MPQIDLPLEELRRYMGKSPRPADYDAYWARALDALGGQSLACTLEPAAFSAPGVACFHLWFTGMGGARVHAKFLRPTAFAGPRPAVLMFHGYEGSSKDWFDKLPFAQSGFAVAALDVRGQAGLSQDAGSYAGSTFQGHIVRGVDDPDPDRLFFRDVYLDTAQLARIVAAMGDVDEKRLYAVGFSQGGALALVCSALTGLVRRTVAGYPFLADFCRVAELDYPSRAYDELKLYFRLRDPQHKTEQRFFQRLGYLDVQWMAERIRNPVRMYTGLRDTICPPSAQFAVFHRLAGEKEHILYPDFGHEDLPYAWQEILTLLLDDAAKGAGA